MESKETLMFFTGSEVIVAVFISIIAGFILGHLYGFNTAKEANRNLANELYKCMDKDGMPFVEEKEDWKDDDDDEMLQDSDWWKRK